MSKKNKEYNPVSLFEEFGFGAATLMNEIKNNKQNKGNVLRGVMLRLLFIIFYIITLVLGLYHIIRGLFEQRK